jgi:hypothetical protein
MHACVGEKKIKAKKKLLSAQKWKPRKSQARPTLSSKIQPIPPTPAAYPLARRKVARIWGVPKPIQFPGASTEFDGLQSLSKTTLPLH